MSTNAGCRHFSMLLLVVLGTILGTLGPVVGFFVVDPFIQLILAETQILTPKTDCLDYRKPGGQVCERTINLDYYMFDVTNKEAWLAGTEPPKYKELGPFAFDYKEIRYNISFSDNWTKVEYGYHTWQEFNADRSCEECSLDAEVTGVNRGYLQFLSSSNDAETPVIYTLMPMVLSIVKSTMMEFIGGASAGGLLPITPEMYEATALQQWADCSVLLPIVQFLPQLGMTEPYFTDIPQTPPVPGTMELCATITALSAVAPENFAVAGLTVNPIAAGAWMAAAIGQSTSTYIDPLSQQFIGGFMTIEKPTFLGVLSDNPETALLAGALSLITDTQWSLLQGYVVHMVNTWGVTVFKSWLESQGGGMVVTKTADQWLHGFVDPLLFAGFQLMDQSQPGGPTGQHLLTPWLYTPSLAVSYPAQDTPLQYFSTVTGQEYTYNMLSWNSSDIGRFDPLIQQKKLETGKSAGTIPQSVLEYRAVSFLAKPMGIHNMTGVNEGSALGPRLDGSRPAVQFDSALSRPLEAASTGVTTKLKKVPVLQYNLTRASTTGCNFGAFEQWAGLKQFDPAVYAVAAQALQPGTSTYWPLHQSPTALRAHLQQSGLSHDFGHYYGSLNIARDRCSSPDLLDGIWDMSSVYSCPIVFSLPHFFNASQAVLAGTGDPGAWTPDPDEHKYYISVEPITGFAIQGHRTYQTNHLVGRSVAYPSLTVVPGSGAASGSGLDDFIVVPAVWLKMWWEPTDKDANSIYALSQGQDAFYYLLVLVFPPVGTILLLIGLFFLNFSKFAKKRAIELANNEVSRAGSNKLTSHHRDMAEALARKMRGSIGVVMPPSREGSIVEEGEEMQHHLQQQQQQHPPVEDGEHEDDGDLIGVIRDIESTGLADVDVALPGFRPSIHTTNTSTSNGGDNNNQNRRPHHQGPGGGGKGGWESLVSRGRGGRK